MKKIEIYDYDDKRIDELCEKHDLSPHALIELLLDEVESMSDSEREKLLG